MFVLICLDIIVNEYILEAHLTIMLKPLTRSKLGFD